MAMEGAEGTKLGSAFVCPHTPWLVVGWPFGLFQPLLQSLRGTAAAGVSVASGYVLSLAAPFRLGSITVFYSDKSNLFQSQATCPVVPFWSGQSGL